MSQYKYCIIEVLPLIDSGSTFQHCMCLCMDIVAMVPMVCVSVFLLVCLRHSVHLSVFFSFFKDGIVTHLFIRCSVKYLVGSHASYLT